MKDRYVKDLVTIRNWKTWGTGSGDQLLPILSFVKMVHWVEAWVPTGRSSCSFPKCVGSCLSCYAVEEDYYNHAHYLFILNLILLYHQIWRLPMSVTIEH